MKTTAKQKQARAKFKTKIAAAKKIKKANPKKKWATCVKEAWKK